MWVRRAACLCFVTQGVWLGWKPVTSSSVCPLPWQVAITGAQGALKQQVPQAAEAGLTWVMQHTPADPRTYTPSPQIHTRGSPIRVVARSLTMCTHTLQQPSMACTPHQTLKHPLHPVPGYCTQFPNGPPRSVEDLKDRYYSIARKLLVAREGTDATVLNNPLLRQPYNANHERARRAALHTLMTRNPGEEAAENEVRVHGLLAGWLFLGSLGLGGMCYVLSQLYVHPFFFAMRQIKQRALYSEVCIVCRLVTVCHHLPFGGVADMDCFPTPQAAPFVVLLPMHGLLQRRLSCCFHRVMPVCKQILEKARVVEEKRKAEHAAAAQAAAAAAAAAKKNTVPVAPKPPPPAAEVPFNPSDLIYPQVLRGLC